MKILITGITGQDGRLLAEFLLGQGHVIVGTCRPRTQNLPDLGIDIRYIDITDCEAMSGLLSEDFDEIYNLAGQTHVGASFEHPSYSFQVNAVGVLNVLGAAGDTPVYQASTSEMYGHSTDIDGRSSETTEMVPHSPYGVAKLAAHHAVRISRLSYGRPHFSGILFNHESELRGPEFVTRKVSDYVKSGNKKPLSLGNLDSKRDWGCAREYVRAMVDILRANRGDYVVATGNTHSVRQWIEVCFRMIGDNLVWDGDKGYDRSGTLRIEGGNLTYTRPLDIECLCGNPTLIQNDLHWRALRTIDDIARDMIEGTEDDAYYSLR